MSLADLVREVVDEVRPANIDPAAITVTDEGPESEIVVVPHRDLDGISLVAWADPKGARLLWAHVGDLSRHDDLDLGVVVESMSYHLDWQARLRDAIAAELKRAIWLRSRTGWFQSPRVECSILVGGKERGVGVIRLRRDQGGTTEGTTYLASGPRPWFSVPPKITNAR